VTHPFHPWFNLEFVFIGIRQAWGEYRVFLLDTEGVQHCLPVPWTDAAEPDVFVVMAAGRCAFRLRAGAAPRGWERPLPLPRPDPRVHEDRAPDGKPRLVAPDPAPDVLDAQHGFTLAASGAHPIEVGMSPRPSARSWVGLRQRDDCPHFTVRLGRAPGEPGAHG